MSLDAIIEDDTAAREAALEAAASAPEHVRSALASRLSTLAREAAVALEGAAHLGPDAAAPYEARLVRACAALARLRALAAKNALLRIADEGTRPVKDALARSLRTSRTAEARAVLVHLLSDDEARGEAILAIGEAPWPDVLPALIEIAEGDDLTARLAALPIARCGATAGPNEANAAADFLLEQLDDEVVLGAAALALLRYGARFSGVAAKGRLLAKEPGRKKAVGVCLVAAFEDIGNAGLLELALAGTRTDEAAARSFLRPLLDDPDEHVRAAALRTAKAMGVAS
jgi:hypothetical protein